MVVQAVPALKVENLSVTFPVRSSVLRRVVGSVSAVDDVSFEIPVGTTLGLVGESGCGKTTTAHAVLRLNDPSAGRILYQGEDITRLGQSALKAYRRDMQIVLQDPFASLNPRMSVQSIVAEPLRIHSRLGRHEQRAQVAELLELVGLQPDHADRYPHEFSGGQRQRIGIARALALRPRFLVLDEPVSALDVSIQAQIVNLLRRLQRELSLTYLVIAHDLAVVRHMCDTIAVMYLGKVVEHGPTERIYEAPTHPYTKSLLSAVPSTRADRPERIVLEGEIPSPASPPSGCRFRTRCWKAQARCAEEIPPLEDRGDGRTSACFFPEPVPAG